MCNSNHDARRLYDDLLRKNRYNRLIRPVGNSTDKLTVKMGLKLAQVLDVVSGRHSNDSFEHLLLMCIITFYIFVKQDCITII